MPTMSVGPDSAVELQDIANTMGKSRKMVLITGAGISTNCGIPDFRSEDGLYSLIQAQYDAAVLNPPWEQKGHHDIDDRPKKKRRPWFYEVVKEDGTVVDVIDEENKESEETPAEDTTTPSTPSLPTSSSSRSSRSKSETPASSPLSSPPPSSPTDSSTIETSTPPSERADDSTVASSQSSRPDLPNLKGRDLFDSMVWKDAFTTSIFYMFISSLRQKIQDVPTPTVTHNFIKTLQDRGCLVRNYTQNIDCLEERLGLCSDLSVGPGSKTRFHAKVQRERLQCADDSNVHSGVQIVQLHGSLSQLRCGLCLKLCSWEEGERAATIGSGQAPDCPSCTEYNAKRTGRGRRGLAVGRLRPDIVLYGEEHPKANLVGPIVTHDLSLGPDVLLILGTSLRVHGLKVIIREFAKTIHSRGGKVVFVNRTKPPESIWGDVIDYWVGWDCDAWVADLKERRPDLWLPMGSAQEESKSRRQSGVDTKPAKKKPSIPQVERDCQLNGVFYTFKILDTLRKLPDTKGDLAVRRIYWPNLRKVPRTSLGKAVKNEPLPDTAHPKPKAPAKAKPANGRKPLPNSSKSRPQTANSSKKRKSEPIVLTPEQLEIWEGIRRIAPSLSERPPGGRVPLQVLHENMPSWLKPFSFGITHNNTSEPYRSASPNHLPKLSGLDMPLKKNELPDLSTHPPSGLDIPIHTPHKLRPPTSHAYGTRSSQRWQLDSDSNSTIVVQSAPPKVQSRQSSWGSSGGTIVVQTPVQQRTPPDSSSESRAMTPDSERIRHMGRIGAILDSPEAGSEVFEDANESQASQVSQEVFYDAKSD